MFPASQLTVRDGVFSVNGGNQVSYGQLLQGKRIQSHAEQRGPVPKNPKDYTVLGTAVPRIDLPALKLRGSFSMSSTWPPAWDAARKGGPAAGSGARKWSTSIRVLLRRFPGNVQVVVKNDFVGVVADTEWNATQAATALTVAWSAGPMRLPDQNSLYTWMQQQSSADSLTVGLGGYETQTLIRAAKRVTAQYLYPFQMHGGFSQPRVRWPTFRGGTGLARHGENLVGDPRSLSPNATVWRWFLEFPRRMYVSLSWRDQAVTD